MSSIAYCGLDCSVCPALRALKFDDYALRRQTADAWSQLFQTEIRPEQIACQGCHSDQGPLFAHCDNCAVRACARERGMDTCARCQDYPCDKLEFIHQGAPQAKQNLDRLRQKI
ncbi:MAG: DUF3795 domain-containing protein [Proteobacteria bacterium]|nr:DUF3795 domain-containing protein [Pseudomonadota bacterium]MBU2516637.1 DUF3795 domain-containing protein [Pseudomonadota bacterium]